ncbi:MAG: hypothetical protein FJY76_03590 [Candidatus Aenigmarchaeota archaeon]|nr:hypothetical protein [Candidatus Aenigmarchaeota archaeon]
MVNNSEINLVVARLMTMPDSDIVSAGPGNCVMNREALIEHVKNAKKDEIGRKIVESHMSYLRSLGRS